MATQRSTGSAPAKLASLRGIGAAWVEPLPIERTDNIDRALRIRQASALRTLRRLNLGNRDIRAFVRDLRTERARDTIVNSWPTVGEDRKKLERIAALASLLGAELASASPKASSELATGMLVTLGVITPLQRLQNDLPSLTEACLRRLEVMPKQSHARSHSNVIRVVALALAPLNIAPTVSRGRFHEACEAAFALAGVVTRKGERSWQPSPTASIRAFLRG